MNTLPPHLQRVALERAELQAKHEALTTFLASGHFRQLPAAEQDRLSRQHGIMAQYLAVLTERLNACEQTPLPRGVCIIPWRAGRFAVSQRTNTSGSGLWQFPGGGVEPGEDVATAAVRELREETSLDLAAHMVRLTPLCYMPAVGYKGEKYARAAFGFVVAPGEELASPEAEKHTPWQWVTREELHQLPMLDGTHELAETWHRRAEEEEQERAP